ncbi:MAG: aminocarboxymuconate-semialdehyde decarboxylase [Alphaproteobacteria bacterium]|jgi:aminocarboxymuconate-semialdehyde decarboxylase
MANVIDVHAHYNDEEARGMMKAAAEKGKVGEHAKVQVGIGITGERSDNELVLSEPDWRLKDMLKMGVDFAVLSPAPPRGFYEADGDLSTTVARHINDKVAAIVKDNPDRFLSMGVGQLQHVNLAIREMERAVGDLGLRGIRFPTEINGMELSDPALEPFWDAAESLGTTIYVHPQGFTHPQRMKGYYMTNVVANPLETTLATSHLIHSGVIKRHPGLTFYMAHGGGFFPFYAGRFDHAYTTREECRVAIDEPPSAYVRNLYYDTVVFEPRQLRYLIDLVGADHIMLGTDSPYDMGEMDPVGMLERVEGLTDAEREAILRGTAKKVFKMH